MRMLVAVFMLAALIFAAGCHTSGSIGVGYHSSPTLHQACAGDRSR